MRLYTNVKPLASGATAHPKNKGLLVCNSSTSSTIRPFLVNILNYDNTITGVTLGTYGANLNAPNQIYPNYSYVPFHVTSWSDLSGVTLQAFELF